jgi:arginase
MELAPVIGRCPEIVTNSEGRRPLVRDEDAAVFGFRDVEHAAAGESQPLAPTYESPEPRRLRNPV